MNKIICTIVGVGKSDVAVVYGLAGIPLRRVRVVLNEPRGRHIRSKVRGTLEDGVTDAALLDAMHPTPAVGVHPRNEALEQIHALEPFDRGWYAGPVGWIGQEASEFAVGIRSGLVRGRTLALYSGAGIVAGSVPDEEWAEIEQKIGDFTGMFGLEQGHAAS